MRSMGLQPYARVLGRGTQIVAYTECKRAAVARGADGGATATHVPCALASAAVSILCVNPVDVVRTRLYNAPPGRCSACLEDALARSRSCGHPPQQRPAHLLGAALRVREERTCRVEAVERLRLRPGAYLKPPTTLPWDPSRLLGRRRRCVAAGGARGAASLL